MVLAQGPTLKCNKKEQEMNESWFQAYVLLAFRIEKALRAISEDSPLVDDYYGPAAWRTQVEAEPPTPAPVLLQTAKDIQRTRCKTTSKRTCVSPLDRQNRASPLYKGHFAKATFLPIQQERH